MFEKGNSIGACMKKVQGSGEISETERAYQTAIILSTAVAN